MIISLKWLRDYVDISMSVDEMCERLTMAGLEIEGRKPLHPYLSNVVTARVESVEPHPQADRLHICSVSDGQKSYRVVCGAPNVQTGAVAVLALPGAELAGGLELKETRIRGEFSQGMLCSRKELGVDEDHGGIWLLPSETPLGVPLSQALDLDDTIIEVSITPNRGDCLSFIGIAREVAAISRSALKYPEIGLAEKGPEIKGLSSVTIEDAVGCPRYAARIVRGITIGPSPAWLRSRLEAVGLRSINSIVDVTNYVMMELGQPLHAFDFDRLREHRIVVRRAAAGERFTTLDGVERELFDDTLLICDGEGAVAVAGIMGGLDSEIVASTRDVLIESAYFQPECIRRSSKKLGLRSESSYRFERGIDPKGVIRALDRAARLMAEVGGGEIAKGRIDEYPAPIPPVEITFRVDRADRFLGTRIELSEMADALRSIEMDVRERGADRLLVTAPSFRPDITREVDLSEEVARLVGYDRIPVTYPKGSLSTAPPDPNYSERQRVKEALVGFGFSEALTYSFISLDSLRKLRLPAGDLRLRPIPLRNPLSEEQAVMRTTLLPGLLNAALYNLDRRNEDIRIFELSKVFLPREGEPLPDEPHHAAGVMTGRKYPHLLYGGEEAVDYSDAKGVVEGILRVMRVEGVKFDASETAPYLDPFCSAEVVRGTRRLGRIGRLHREVEESFDFKAPIYIFELDFDGIFKLDRPEPFFKSLPKFPSVARDMALIVDEGLPVQEPVDFILGQNEPLLELVDIFDIYRSRNLGEGKKSLGYRLVYRSSDRSLTDEEVNVIHGRLVERVLKTFHAGLR